MIPLRGAVMIRRSLANSGKMCREEHEMKNKGDYADD